MRLGSITPNTRVALYQVWRATAVLLPVLGVVLPGDPSVWDQLVLALLGLAGAGAATVAIVHTPPNPPPE